MANENVENAVKAFIGNGDNVEFMSGLKNAIYDKLSEHPIYDEISTEFSKYVNEYDKDNELFKKAE